MRERFAKIMSIALAGILAMSLVPAVSFANEGAQDASLEASSMTEEQRAEIISDVEADAGTYLEDSIIVVYEKDTSESSGMRALDDAGLGTYDVETLADELAGEGTAVKVELPEGTSVAEAVADVSAQPGVAYAQPNYRYDLIADYDGATLEEDTSAQSGSDYSTLSTFVDDPYANISEDTYMTEGSSGTANQWWLYSVDAFGAWDAARAEGKVEVAVLDTGINFDHEDLRNVIDTEFAYDAYAQEQLTTNPTSSYSHGSHVAGIIAGQANNNAGIAGISYNATILPIQVFYTSAGETYTSDDVLIRAYNYIFGLIDAGNVTNLRVVNMSLGGYGAGDAAFEAIINEAEEDYNILTVAAGGNGDDYGNPLTSVSYPSDYDAVMSVVAIDSNDERGSWCDYNEYKDISAPGLYIWSTWYTGNQYYRASGTSMASPLVAGVAALLWSVNPDLSVAEVKDAIYSTATDLGAEGRDNYYGYGKINPAAAIAEISGARVKRDADSIYRTQTLQLSAEPLVEGATVDSWIWSVDDESVATVDENGLLTGLQAGTVTVTVVASNDENVHGRAAIEIKEIELSEELTVDSSGNDGLQLIWGAAPAATSYQIYRSANNNTSFELIATVDAETCTYKDASTQASTPYYYYVVPCATLGSEMVSGLRSETTIGMYKAAVTELAGDDRYETASDIVNMFSANAALAESSSSTVIIASGEDFPDALAASALAGDLNAPIILTTSDVLSQEAGEQLVSINPVNVVIVGGEAAVSAAVADEVREILPYATIQRKAGATRVKTAEAIYDAGYGDWGKTAIVTTGDSFADALSVSPYAYATKSPVFLTQDDGTLSLVTRQRIKAGGFDRVVIIGGEAAVTTAVEKQLTSLGISFVRWAGSDRYETSYIICEQAVEEGVMSWEGVGFATGTNFPDGLCAGALQGQSGSVLLLVDPESDSAADFERLVSDAQDCKHVTFYGGTSSIPQETRDAITQALGLS